MIASLFFFPRITIGVRMRAQFASVCALVMVDEVHRK